MISYFEGLGYFVCLLVKKYHLHELRFLQDDPSQSGLFKHTWYESFLIRNSETDIWSLIPSFVKVLISF